MPLLTDLVSMRHPVQKRLTTLVNATRDAHVSECRRRLRASRDSALAEEFRTFTDRVVTRHGIVCAIAAVWVPIVAQVQ